ncbi:MAG: dihydropteroate synthase [Chloroflexota bacterium]|nr:dihydropteroate synthase [Chloroflexota bacterium]
MGPPRGGERDGKLLAMLEPGLIRCGTRTLRVGARTLVMGILNLTPDSFSGDGLAARDVDSIVARGEDLVAAGADVIDVGGESTRPGADSVPEDVERDRVLPLIERLAARIDIPISIDTRKAAVAEAAMRAGASIVNDVSGLDYDPRLPVVAADAGAALIVGHWRRRQPDDPADLIEWIAAGLRDGIRRATAAGVPRTRLMVDPGLGFAKPSAWSFGVHREWPRLRAGLGLPILIGASRKRHIGEALGGAPVEERLAGSLAAASVAAAGGADMVRVHDVRESAGAARVADAIGRGWWEEPPAWTPVYLGLGANLGRREETLARALALLGGSTDLRVVRRSSLYETAPVGVTSQPQFLNAVVEAETSLAPPELLRLVQGVEAQLGRQARERWGPREIDVDVLLYGDREISQPGLTVPHPELWNRVFVLAPLHELQPGLFGPGGQPIGERVHELERTQAVRSLNC